MKVNNTVNKYPWLTLTIVCILVCTSCVTVPGNRPSLPDLYITRIGIEPAYRTVSSNTRPFPKKPLVKLIGYHYFIEITNIGTASWKTPVLLSYTDNNSSVRSISFRQFVLLDSLSTGIHPGESHQIHVTIEHIPPPGIAVRFEINPPMVTPLFPGILPIREVNPANNAVDFVIPEEEASLVILH